MNRNSQAESNGIDTQSGAPLRILVTRRTERDRIISVQYLLSSWAISRRRSFRAGWAMRRSLPSRPFKRQTACRKPELSPRPGQKVYEVAGKEEPPVGHLFVRQDFKPVFDTPVVIRDPENVLGMHVFTAIFASDDLNARWMAIS